MEQLGATAKPLALVTLGVLLEPLRVRELPDLCCRPAVAAGGCSARSGCCGHLADPHADHIICQGVRPGGLGAGFREHCRERLEHSLVPSTPRRVCAGGHPPRPAVRVRCRKRHPLRRVCRAARALAQLQSLRWRQRRGWGEQAQEDTNVSAECLLPPPFGVWQCGLLTSRGHREAARPNSTAPNRVELRPSRSRGRLPRPPDESAGGASVCCTPLPLDEKKYVYL